MGRKSWGLPYTVLTQSLLRCSALFTLISSRAPLVHGVTKHKSCQLATGIRNDVQLNFARCISNCHFLFLPHQFLPPSLFFCRRPGPKRRPVKRRIPRSELEDIVDVYIQASSCQKALLFLLPFFLLLCRCSISLMKRRRRNKMRKRVGRHMMGDNL